MRLVTANCDKECGGTRRYVRYLRRLTRSGVLFTSERGHGEDSTRVRGVRMLVRSKRRIEVGHVGVHRWIVRGTVKLNGQTVTVFSVHGPHKDTVGAKANLDYLVLLAGIVARVDGPWIVGGDFNRDVHLVSDILGGNGHGVGVDGFVTSDGIRVTALGTDDQGKRNGWTDHPAVWIDVA